MAFSDHAIFSLITGFLVLCSSLESAIAQGGTRGAMTTARILHEEVGNTDHTHFYDPGETGLCGLFALHAGTAINFASGNQIIGGRVGVDASSDYTSPMDLMVYKDYAQPALVELGGKTFTPGYHKAVTLNLGPAETVILSGNATDVWIFYADTTMLTGANSEIVLQGGALASNVYWVLGTTLTAGAGTIIKGSISAGTAVTLATRTTVEGCIVAGSAITYGSENEVNADCENSPGGTVCSPDPDDVEDGEPERTHFFDSDQAGLCGPFALHAGTAIIYAPGNQIIGGRVGVEATSDYTSPVDLMDYKADADAQPGLYALGGKTFTPGYYKAVTLSLGPAENVTLSGNSTAVWIFYADTTMLTGANSEIVLQGGALAKNVYWILGTTLTTGANTIIKGSVSAGTAVTFAASTTVKGCIAAGSAITFGAGNEVNAGTISPPDQVEEAEAEDTPFFESNQAGLCGLFALHAGTAINFSSGNQIIGGRVGVEASSDYTRPTDLTRYKADEFGAEDIAVNLANSPINPIYPGFYRATTFNLGPDLKVYLSGNSTGNSTAVFIFYAATTMLTGAGSEIVLQDGALASNVYWVLGTTLTTGANTIIKGSISAGTAVTLASGTTVEGCIAAGSAITFGSGNEVNADCENSPGGTVCSPDPDDVEDGEPERTHFFDSDQAGLCGLFALHAGTAINFAPDNQIIGGRVGVEASSTYTRPMDLMDYNADEFGAEDIAVNLANSPINPIYPGFYRATTLSLGANGKVYLSGNSTGNSTAVFIFYAATTMLTGAGSEIVLQDGAKAENVYWILGTTLTTGANTIIRGSISAGTAVTVATGTTVQGCIAAGSAITFGAVAEVNADCENSPNGTMVCG
jgi:type IV secretory pathway TrbD component